MSYILDALKKAESERRLGSVPSVHAQPISVTSFNDISSPWSKTWIWAALAVLLITAGMLVWFQPWQLVPGAGVTASPVPPVPGIGMAPDVQVPAPATQRGPSPQTDSAITSATPAPVVPPQADMTKPPEASIAEPRTPKPEPKSAKKSRESKPAPPAASSELKATKKTEAVPVTVPTEKRVAALRELPENIQREIPALAVGGFIYSNRPSERSVLINNKLLHEGDEVTPGLTLEKMMPKEAVLNYRGYRYRIPY